MSDPIKEILKDTTIMAALAGDCVKCVEYHKRIAELEAEYARFRDTTQRSMAEDAQRIAELEAEIKAWEQDTDIHDANAMAEAAEAALERVRALRKIPWFDSHGNKIYDYVRADELEAALKEGE